MAEEQKQTTNPTTPVITPPAVQAAITAEEANKMFQDGEVTLDEHGNPVARGGADSNPQEGATLRKRHAWY